MNRRLIYFYPFNREKELSIDFNVTLCTFQKGCVLLYFPAHCNPGSKIFALTLRNPEISVKKLSYLVN